MGSNCMEYVPRNAESEIEKWLDDKEIILIRGPRQSGKTTLLYKIRETLLKRGINENDIVMVTFEDDLERMKFEKNPKEVIGFHQTKKTWFLFDEIQYVNNIGKILKLLYDIYPNAKFIVTGSSSFDLIELGKYLVGRVVFVDVLPFDFLEFLRAKSPKHEKKLVELRAKIWSGKKVETAFLEEFNSFLRDYLRYGAYPRIVLEEDQSKKVQLLKTLFSNYVEKDVVARFGNKYREPAILLLKTLAASVGNPVKYETLSQQSGVSYNEVKSMLPLLQDALVIGIIKPFYKNISTEIRKNPKVYFLDNGFRNNLLGDFSGNITGQALENFVYCQLISKGKINYWRTTSGGELDFIVGDLEIAVEVKKAGKTSKSFTNFLCKYAPKKTFIVSLDELGYGETNGKKYLKIPAVYL
ncbi:MAG: ATP-binding protein [Candidatus Micrarchaeota archaeon]